MSIAFFFIRENRCPKTNTHCHNGLENRGIRDREMVGASFLKIILTE
jgi:hypothetical protein